MGGRGKLSYQDGQMTASALEYNRARSSSEGERMWLVGTLRGKSPGAQAPKVTSSKSDRLVSMIRRAPSRSAKPFQGSGLARATSRLRLVVLKEFLGLKTECLIPALLTVGLRFV